MSLLLSAPQSLLAAHDVTSFACGNTELDGWLKKRALSNHESGASRVFVSTSPDGRVYGYYALAAGAIAHVEAIGNVRRNMPAPIPVVVLGRLARDVNVRGIQLGASLLQDAVKRAAAVSKDMGIRAMLVHAIDDRAVAFYEAYGFKSSPMHPMTLVLRLS
jgi:GNAT superfamily N-acetyltransferase